MFRGELWVLVADNGKVEGVTDGDSVTFTAGQGHRVAHVIEVIHCRECKFGEPTHGATGDWVRCHWPQGPKSGLYGNDNRPDWYCPRGERP